MVVSTHDAVSFGFVSTNFQVPRLVKLTKSAVANSKPSVNIEISNIGSSSRFGSYCANETSMLGDRALKGPFIQEPTPIPRYVVPGGTSVLLPANNVANESFFHHFLFFRPKICWTFRKNRSRGLKTPLNLLVAAILVHRSSNFGHFERCGWSFCTPCAQTSPNLTRGHSRYRRLQKNKTVVVFSSFVFCFSHFRWSETDSVSYVTSGRQRTNFPTKVVSVLVKKTPVLLWTENWLSWENWQDKTLRQQFSVLKHWVLETLLSGSKRPSVGWTYSSTSTLPGLVSLYDLQATPKLHYTSY